MIDFKITLLEDPELLDLVEQLGAELSARYQGLGYLEKQATYLPEGAIAVLMLLVDVPVGCAVLHPADNLLVAEISGMYIAPIHRSRGYGRKLTEAIEKVAATLNIKTIRLGAGAQLPEAIQLFHSCGYRRIPPFGTYAELAGSVCLEKHLVSPGGFEAHGAEAQSL